MNIYRSACGSLLLVAIMGSAQAAPRPANHAELAALKQGFGLQALNPDSLEFRNVLTANINGLMQTCGELRSKDAKGVYGPYVRFFATLLETGSNIGFAYSQIDQNGNRNAHYVCQQDGLMPGGHVKP